MVVAAPCYTRPESEQWFCSLRLGVLEGDVKSRSLKRAFGWDRPLPGLVLAVQLVSLSMKFEVCMVWLACCAPSVACCFRRRCSRRCSASPLHQAGVVPLFYSLLLSL